MAAKALAMTGADLFADPQLVLAAKADFQKELRGQKYTSVIPEGQKVSLWYWRE
jgi:hypothetical protein